MDKNYPNNIFRQKYAIKRREREKHHKHKSIAIWLTGLSGSGKSSIANCVEQNLFKNGISTYVLDGDNIRLGLCSDLGFSKYDRKENIRRIGELVKLMLDAGILVLVSVISPYKKDREMVFQLLGKKNILEVFVDTPISICQKRDPKNLYKKSYNGKLLNFTGIQSIYEKPDKPDLYLDGTLKIEINAQKIINILHEYNIF